MVTVHNDSPHTFVVACLSHERFVESVRYFKEQKRDSSGSSSTKHEEGSSFNTEGKIGAKVNIEQKYGQESKSIDESATSHEGSNSIRTSSSVTFEKCDRIPPGFAKVPSGKFVQFHVTVSPSSPLHYVTLVDYATQEEIWVNVATLDTAIRIDQQRWVISSRESKL